MVDGIIARRIFVVECGGMELPEWVRFFRRRMPSANCVLLAMARPVLIDTGYGSDVEELIAWVEAEGVRPEDLALVVNTHFHADHVGGNAELQRRYAVRVAASGVDAEVVNRWEDGACERKYLDQPVERYRVDVALADGDEIDAGEVRLRVVATPGHLPGQVALFEEGERLLFAGDAVHADDVAWLNVGRDGMGVLDEAMASVERLKALRPRWMCSGHGPAADGEEGPTPVAAMEAAVARYGKWKAAPEKCGWHAAKRIFVYFLMLMDGLETDVVQEYLEGCPWLADMAAGVFGMDAAKFAEALREEAVRSGAVTVEAGKMIARTPYAAPTPEWLWSVGKADLGLG